jgi:hypothetical protein
VHTMFTRVDDHELISHIEVHGLAEVEDVMPGGMLRIEIVTEKVLHFVETGGNMFTHRMPSCLMIVSRSL